MDVPDLNRIETAADGSSTKVPTAGSVFVVTGLEDLTGGSNPEHPFSAFELGRVRLVPAFGGVVYGLLYLRYRSVWLCILAHAANNLLVATGIPMLIAWLHEIGVLQPLQGNLLVLQLSWAAVVLACFAMFLACLRRKDEVTTPALVRSG